MKRILSLSMALLMLLTVVTVGTPIVAAQDQSVEPSAGPVTLSVPLKTLGWEHFRKK